MDTQLKEVRDEMVRMQEAFRLAKKSPMADPADEARLNAKLTVLDELLRFVNSRPERAIPEGLIEKKTLVQYLEPKIEHLHRVVLIYVQDKCFEGGKLSAYREILSVIKKM